MNNSSKRNKNALFTNRHPDNFGIGSAFDPSAQRPIGPLLVVLFLHIQLNHAVGYILGGMFPLRIYICIDFIASRRRHT